VRTPLGEPLNKQPENRRARLHARDDGVHSDRGKVQLGEAEQRDEFVERPATQTHEHVRDRDEYLTRTQKGRCWI
jgi:hypothetical protein